MLHISFGSKAFRGSYRRECACALEIPPVQRGRRRRTRREGIDELDGPRRMKSRDEEPSRRSSKYKRMTATRSASIVL